jgi:hypothetical protein
MMKSFTTYKRATVGLVRGGMTALIFLAVIFAGAGTGNAANTNTFTFNTTTVATAGGPTTPSGALVTVYGTNLASGDVVVFDGVVIDVPGSSGDAWGSVNLNSGGYLGLVNAQLGVLAETGTNSGYRWQLFLNGTGSSTQFGTAALDARTNRVQIRLTCNTTGSTTNMSYVVNIDQGATGTFNASLSGSSAVTFSNNAIALSFGANNAAHQFVQTQPIIAVSAPAIASTNLAAGVAASFTATITQGYPLNTTQQWLSNGVPVPGATRLTYSTPPVNSSYNGAQYSVIVTNLNTAGNVVTSSVVTLSVRSVPGTVPFIFATNSIPNGTQVNPLTPPESISGTSLLSGDTLVFDAIISTNGPLTGSFDGWCGVDFAAAAGTPAQAVGGTFSVLVRLGAGVGQLFLNGSTSSANNPTSSGASTNRLHVEFYPSATGSTTNMGWMVEVDQNLTGTFLPAVRGTNLTFPGNTIPLSFGGYSAPVLVAPYPVGTPQALRQQLNTTNLLIGSFEPVIVTADYMNVSNFVLAPSTPGLNYASSDSTIVTVSGGNLQGVGAGQATVTSSFSSLSASNAVTVVDPGALLSISLVVTNQMQLYSTQQASVLGTFANATNVNMFTFGQTTFPVNNQNIVSISPSGLITAIAPGTVVLNAVNSGVSSSIKQITVSFPTNRFIFDSFGDGFWSIVNQGNSNTLVVSPSGASQATATNTAFDQQFELLYNYQNSTFRIRNRATWQCLASKPGNTVGNGVIPVNYTGTSQQQWYLVDVGNGFFRIVNSTYGLVLQTDNGNPANVTLVNPSSSPYQNWSFSYKAHYPKKGFTGFESQYAQYQFSWAYNYDDNTTAVLPSQVDYVPMIHDGAWEPLSDVQSRSSGWRVQPQPDYLLTYNEPDNSSQANMSTNQVIGLWPQLQALNVPLVSPAMQHIFDAWAYNFFDLIASNNYRVDYTAVHLYVQPDASFVMGQLQSAYTTWGRPVWLTEFSPVDWSNTKSWSENDDYNFLAEFMWQAESQEWFKRYSVFAFGASNSASPWVDNGFIGAVFLADGQTLAPYGELYAAWDADMNLDARTPYILHNLGTSFRMTETNNAGGPSASTIYTRNSTTEWALLPAPTSNHWYIVSLNDGRRLRDTGGTLNFAPYQSTGSTLEWEFNGPDGNGYYFITNTAGRCLNGSGTAPSIVFNTTSSSTQNTSTQWRLVKPYQPVVIATAAPPTVAISYSNQSATLSWSGSGTYYNVYRAGNTGGPYVKVMNLTASSNYTDTGLTNGAAYYYVVTALNILGDESAYSTEVVARPASTAVPTLGCNPGAGGGLQFNWPMDHTGWRLLMNTNGLNLSNAWVAVSNTISTNQILIPFDPTQSNVFFRLVYP